MPAMKTRRIVLHGQTRAKLRRSAKRCKDADTRTRYRIVLLSSDGWSGKRIGLERFDALPQFWFGTTTPFRTTLAAVQAGDNLLGSSQDPASAP